MKKNIAIIGGGNIGTAIARGLLKSGLFKAHQITVTRRHIELLEDLKKLGIQVTRSNIEAINHSSIIILAVQPQQASELLEEMRDSFDEEKHIIISVISGVSSDEIFKKIGADVPVVRAMPNTAISVGESMTCIASKHASEKDFQLAQEIFNSVGATMKIDEKLMTSATSLCACGVAFFLRAIRAAAQGGIEIGFHPHEAIPMAAQTAKGAAALLLNSGENHPEREIDRVTTPRGCTISGLNEMEHKGFSSAMIKGIILSAEKADRLYQDNGQ